jgi:PAS domain S-box-containing protein
MAWCINQGKKMFFLNCSRALKARKKINGISQKAGLPFVFFIIPESFIFFEAISNNFLLIHFIIFILWFSTFLIFFSKTTRQRKKYIHVLEKHLLEKAETTNALQKSEQQYQELIHGMNEGLILTDHNNIIRFANSKCCSILDTQPLKLVNRPLKNFVFGETEVLKNLVSENGGPPFAHKEEVQMLRGDGELIWASLSISYQESQELNKKGSIIVLSDITSKKQAENELRDMTFDLNQKIKQLNCLYDIYDITGVPGLSFDGIFERCLEVIPNGLKYSHNVCMEITFDDKKFTSKNFFETPWMITLPIRAQKKKLGEIKVGYLEEKPVIKKDPFHINEKILLKNIAEKLGQIIEARNIQHSLQAKEYGKTIVNK